MERMAVKSSNVISIGYDRNSGTLEIEFTGNTVYQYFEVPEHIYDELMAATSIGKFIAANIKGSYRYAQVQ